MRKAPRIRITIGRFGEEPRKVEVPEKSTIEEVLRQEGISLSPTEKIWVDGDQAGMKDIIEEKDVLNIVGSKQGGF